LGFIVLHHNILYQWCSTIFLWSTTWILFTASPSSAHIYRKIQFNKKSSHSKQHKQIFYQQNCKNYNLIQITSWLIHGILLLWACWWEKVIIVVQAVNRYVEKDSIEISVQW